MPHFRALFDSFHSPVLEIIRHPEVVPKAALHAHKWHDKNVMHRTIAPVQTPLVLPHHSLYMDSFQQPASSSLLSRELPGIRPTKHDQRLRANRKSHLPFKWDMTFIGLTAFHPLPSFVSEEQS